MAAKPSLTLDARDGKIALNWNISDVRSALLKHISETGLSVDIEPQPGMPIPSLAPGVSLSVVLNRDQFHPPLIINGQIEKMNHKANKRIDAHIRFHGTDALSDLEPEHTDALRQTVMRFAMIKLRNTRQALEEITNRIELSRFKKESSTIRPASPPGSYKPDLPMVNNETVGGAPVKPSERKSSSMMTPTTLHQMLGDILVQKGQLTSSQLKEFLARRQVNGRRIGQQLVDEGLVSSQAVAEALAYQAGIPYINLRHIDYSTVSESQFTLNDMVTYRFIPIYNLDRLVKIAVANPLDADLLYRFRKRIGATIKQELAEETLVTKALETLTKRLEPDEPAIKSRKPTVSLSVKQISIRVQYELFDNKGKPLTNDVQSGLLKQIGRESIHFIGPARPHVSDTVLMSMTDMIGLEVFLPNLADPLVMVAKPAQITELRDETDFNAFLFEVILIDIDQYTALKLTEFRESL